jgi:hypothetical protein
MVLLALVWMGIEVVIHGMKVFNYMPFLKIGKNRDQRIHVGKKKRKKYKTGNN